jgi:iron(III) transport system substrate-binding protein
LETEENSDGAPAFGKHGGLIRRIGRFRPGSDEVTKSDYFFKERCPMQILVVFLSFCLSASALGQDKGWEKQWNELVAAAKKERSVAVMSSAGGTEVRTALTQPFRDQYGVEVEYLRAPSASVIASRVKTERAAGQFLWDIFIGGTSTPMTALRPEGALEPIEPALLLPEVKDGRNWFGGKLEFAEKQRLILIMLSYSKSAIFVNTNLVKSEDFKSLKDLLDPKWKGKLLSGDPRVAGPGQATFAFFYEHKELGADFIRKLAGQNIQFLRDYRQGVEWLAMGKYPILIGGSDVDAELFIKQGLPVRIVNPGHLKEGGYLTVGPGAVALLNKAAHPNAAKLYLNWLLSKEGQTVFAKAVGYASRRQDVPRPVEPWKYPPQQGYWISYDEAAVTGIRIQLLPLLKEVFGD